MSIEEKFNHVDSTPKFNFEVPTITSITVKRMLDDNPDLSYLQDEKRYSDVKSKKLREKYIAEDKRRFENYGNTWQCIGIQAEADLLIPEDSTPRSYLIQTLHSGGLWGIESDSEEKYLHDIELEELESIKSIAKKLNVPIADNLTVQYVKSWEE